MQLTRIQKSDAPRGGRAIWAAAASLLIASGIAAGCGKEVDTTPIAGSGGEGGGTNFDDLTAKEFFVDFVYTELDANCGICHSAGDPCVPQFMGTSDNKSYTALKEYVGLVTHSDNSNLIYHGAHTGPALTEFQEELVRVWLDKELAGDEPPSPTLDEALVEIGSCMDEVEFTDTGVYLLAYQQSEHGPCGSCHRTGEAGTWIGYSAGEMFRKNQQLPWIKRLVKPDYDENNRFSGLVPSNRFVDKVENANECGSSHPAALVPVEMENSIQTYVEATLTRWRNQGACE